MTGVAPRHLRGRGAATGCKVRNRHLRSRGAATGCKLRNRHLRGRGAATDKYWNINPKLGLIHMLLYILNNYMAICQTLTVAAPRRNLCVIP